MALANEYVDWILEKWKANKTSFFRSNAFKASVKQRKQEWYNKTAPDTLQRIAFDSIVKNRKSFLMPILGNFSGPENPFANLPKSLAGELLAELHQGEYAGKLILVLQLLNPQITEFDYTLMKDPKLDVVIFRHMVQHCPKVQKFTVSNNVWDDESSFLLRTHPDDLFPIMATRWKNLSFLSLKAVVDSLAVQERFSSVHQSLVHAVCANLPNLSGLEMVVVFQCFSQKDVALLSKMQHLTYLNLTVSSKPNPDKNELSIIIQTAGKLPKLEKFAFSFKDSLKWPRYYACFVDEYGKRYSKKKLTIESIWISESDLERPWPKVLAVEDLHLKELPQIAKILALDTCVQKLHIEEMEPHLVHSLLEKFGPLGVNTLDIGVVPFGRMEGLDFFKVFSNCPYLVNTNICIAAPLMLCSTVSLVIPEHFKNNEYFAINPEKNNLYIIIDTEVELQKSVYLGTKKKLKSLMLINQSQLLALEFVLKQEVKSCLDELERVGIFLPYDEEYFETAAKMVLSLYKRSTCLRRVVVYKKRKYGNKHPEIPIWFTKLMQAFQLPVTFDSDENLLFYKEVAMINHDSDGSVLDEADKEFIDLLICQNFVFQ